MMRSSKRGDFLSLKMAAAQERQWEWRLLRGGGGIGAETTGNWNLAAVSIPDKRANGPGKTVPKALDCITMSAPRPE
jgi:hypothetical protein